MPSSTSKMWTKVSVPIEVYRCDLTKVATTRQFADLVSWAGVGALSSDELAKSLLDETSPPRRGMALLLRRGEQAHYLITNSQVLFDVPQDDTESPPTSTNRSWLLEYNEENRLRTVGSPASTYVRFLSLAIEPTKLHSFPVIFYPYLNIAVVSIGWETKLCRALTAAGHMFVSAGDLAEEPSAEGAEISAIGLASDRSSLDHDIRQIAISKGLVISSRNEAPFF